MLLVTGHARAGGMAPDWATIGATAAQGITIVIYMGVAQAGAIQAGLLTTLPASTPAAVVERASLPDQRSVVTSLGDLLATLERECLGSPSVLIVGNVLLGAQALHTPERVEAVA